MGFLDRLLAPAGGLAAAHADSHYLDTAGELPAWPRFEGVREVEACVVGGGLAGLACAQELARAGRDVVLLETGRIAWAASGRNAGFVSAGFARPILEVEAILGLPAARELFRLSLEGVARVRAVAREAGPDIVQGRGYLKVIRHADTMALERRAERMARDYGHPLEFVGGAQLRDYLDTGRYRAGLLDGGAFHIHPLRYAAALAASAARAGAALHEGSPALSLRQDGAGWAVRLRNGQVRARHVVLATGPLRGPHGPANRETVPVSTFMVAATSLSGRLGRAIAFAGCIGDTRRASDYYRVVEGPRGPVLLWGGRITALPFRPSAPGRSLLRDIVRVYPQLDDLEIRHAWSGVMAYSSSRMPAIGQLQPGLWRASAFGGHGVNTTAMAGSLVASAIASRDDRYRLFEPFAPGWGGGLAGRAAAQTYYWRLKLADALQEMRAGA